MLLEADRGGQGDDVLVLLNGMGTTREVWRPFIDVLEREWSGRWIAPDLRGHGRSPRSESYALEAHAEDVGQTVVHHAPDARAVSVLGHSMGGVIALALASGCYGFTPKAALGLGIKIVWTDAETEGLAVRARAPAKTFATSAEAAAFYLKVAGLRGLVSENSAIARAGLAADGLQLAADPATGLIGPPPMDDLITAARCPVHLAAGESDPMCALADIRLHDPHAVTIAGAAHNAMIEAPERVWDWAKNRV